MAREKSGARGAALVAFVVGFALVVTAGPASASPSQAAAVPFGVPISSPSSVKVVRAYIAALDRHDPNGVCRLFAPALTRFVDATDGPAGGHASCRRTVRWHFHSYYSNHRWQSAQIVRIGRVTVAARGISTVPLTLAHHYICVGPAIPGQPCHPGTYVLPDVIYLQWAHPGWRVIKPGMVFRATELDQPFDAETDYYPPGDSRTIAGPALINPLPTACPRGGTSISLPRHALFDPSGSSVTAPWLDIRGLAVARVNRTTVCFTITLGAPPKPDSAYGIFLGKVANKGIANLFEVQIDGVGEPHVLLAGHGVLDDPRLRPSLPKVGLSGDQLQIEGSSQQFFASRQPFLVRAGTASLQFTEPLLGNPLQTGDGAPQNACLVFPSGQLDQAGNCG